MRKASRYPVIEKNDKIQNGKGNDATVQSNDSKSVDVPQHGGESSVKRSGVEAVTSIANGRVATDLGNGVVSSAGSTGALGVGRLDGGSTVPRQEMVNQSGTKHVDNGDGDDAGFGLDLDFLKDFRGGKVKVDGDFDKKQSRSLELVSMKNLLWLMVNKGDKPYWWVKFIGGRMVTVVRCPDFVDQREEDKLWEEVSRDDDPYAVLNVEDLGKKGLAVAPGAALYFSDVGVFRMVERDRDACDRKFFSAELHFYRTDKLPVNFRRVEIEKRETGNGYQSTHSNDQGQKSDASESRSNPNARSNGSGRPDQPPFIRGGRGGRGGRY